MKRNWKGDAGIGITRLRNGDRDEPCIDIIIIPPPRIDTRADIVVDENGNFADDE